MVEKCVSGKSVTTETLSGVRQGDGVRKSFTVKPLMWSLNASAGLQANLTKRLGVYVEPDLPDSHRHHQIQNDQVEALLLRQLHGGRAVVGG